MLAWGASGTLPFQVSVVSLTFTCEMVGKCICGSAG